MIHKGQGIGAKEYRWSDAHPNYAPRWEVKTAKGWVTFQESGT